MKKLILGAIFVLALVSIGGYLYFDHWYDSGLKKINSTTAEKVSFEVVSGENSDSIGKRLEEAGLISNDLLFKIYLKRSDRAKEIQAGEFQIAQNLTIPEITDVLSNAVNLEVVRVTLIEGWRYEQMATELSKAFTGVEGAVFTSNEFISIASAPDGYEFDADIESFLTKYKPAGKSLEGFLYPNTYEFANDVSTQAVVERLLTEFISKTSSLDLSEDFYDDLILASIVERESATNEERDEIASVFANRLEINMALESDATVNYATGKSNPRPTFEDLRIDSPYNTYKNPGLTPTPICNPRLESIRAAISPADTKYYYFIHEQDGSGQVHFARTLSEHNANVSKYLD